MLQDTGNTSLPVSFQQLVLYTPVDLLKEKERERGGEREEREERERERRGRVINREGYTPEERETMAALCFFFLFCTPSVSNRSWLLSVSFQQLVLHTPVDLLREREEGEGYQWRRI